MSELGGGAVAVIFASGVAKFQRVLINHLQLIFIKIQPLLPSTKDGYDAERGKYLPGSMHVLCKDNNIYTLHLDLLVQVINYHMSTHKVNKIDSNSDRFKTVSTTYSTNPWDMKRTFSMGQAARNACTLLIMHLYSIKLVWLITMYS